MKYIKLIYELNTINSGVEETDFLKKIKIENPALYNKFYSMLKNRGLDIAKKEYLKYDPIYQKQLQSKAKSIETKQKYKENINSIKELLPTKTELSNIIETEFLNSNIRFEMKQNNLPQLVASNIEPKTNITKSDANISFTLKENNTYEPTLEGILRYLSGVYIDYDELPSEIVELFNDRGLDKEDIDGILREISQRKRAHKYKTKFKDLEDNSNEFMYLNNFDGYYIDVSSKLSFQLRYTEYKNRLTIILRFDIKMNIPVYKNGKFNFNNNNIVFTKNEIIKDKSCSSKDEIIKLIIDGFTDLNKSKINKDVILEDDIQFLPENSEQIRTDREQIKLYLKNKLN